MELGRFLCMPQPVGAVGEGMRWVDGAVVCDNYQIGVGYKVNLDTLEGVEWAGDLPDAFVVVTGLGGNYDPATATPARPDSDSGRGRVCQQPERRFGPGWTR